MRHPLTLLTAEVPAIHLRPGRTCLILQDVHNPLADAERGWLARRAREKVLIREFDEYFDMLNLVSGNFHTLADACRRAGISVVYLSLGVEPDESPSAFQQATGWTWESDGPEWGFPDEWRPVEGDRVFVKPGWGALTSRAFATHLRDGEIQSTIIAGTMYDYGIRETCYQLTDYGIASLVASDAVVALTHDGLAHTSGNLAHGLTKLRSTAEILDLLGIMHEEGQVLI